MTLTRAYLAAGAELTRGLLTGRATDDLLAEFAPRIRALTQADVAVIALPDAEHEDLVLQSGLSLGRNG